jgi:hypothetical protein
MNALDSLIRNVTWRRELLSTTVSVPFAAYFVAYAA